MLVALPRARHGPKVTSAAPGDPQFALSGERVPVIRRRSMPILILNGCRAARAHGPARPIWITRPASHCLRAVTVYLPVTPHSLISAGYVK